MYNRQLTHLSISHYSYASITFEILLYTYETLSFALLWKIQLEVFLWYIREFFYIYSIVNSMQVGKVFCFQNRIMFLVSHSVNGWTQ